MRFWFTISWRHGWSTEGVDVRIFVDEEQAVSVAQTRNSVLVEVFQNDKDFRTYIDIHDYEFKNQNHEPMPAGWIDETIMDLGHNRWVVPPCPIMRVGKDISVAAYEAMVKADG